MVYDTQTFTIAGSSLTNPCSTSHGNPSGFEGWYLKSSSAPSSGKIKINNVEFVSDGTYKTVGTDRWYKITSVGGYVSGTYSAGSDVIGQNSSNILVKAFYTRTYTVKVTNPSENYWSGLRDGGTAIFSNDALTKLIGVRNDGSTDKTEVDFSINKNTSQKFKTTTNAFTKDFVDLYLAYNYGHYISAYQVFVSTDGGSNYSQLTYDSGWKSGTANIAINSADDIAFNTLAIYADTNYSNYGSVSFKIMPVWSAVTIDVKDSSSNDIKFVNDANHNGIQDGTETQLDGTVNFGGGYTLYYNHNDSTFFAFATSGTISNKNQLESSKEPQQ